MLNSRAQQIAEPDRKISRFYVKASAGLKGLWPAGYLKPLGAEDTNTE
ncbi:hypothetical protein D1AOALGA4SA_673 [Olavius algarvensis Delta 1 endosymbiont]|nr:hypothetical protein D1AOALGA4SA_673 [Olavius algarvensis Delta 1 endosymbiont]